MSDRDKRGVLVVAGAVVLVAVIAVALIAKGHHDAKARAACAPIANPYGKPPAGYSFEKADLKTQEQLEQRLDLKSFEQYGLDITLAWHGQQVRGFLLSFRSADKSELEEIYGATDRSASSSGRTVHRRLIGDTDTKYLDGKDGSRISWAKEGCTVVLASGVTHADGDKLASAVFS